MTPQAIQGRTKNRARVGFTISLSLSLSTLRSPCPTPRRTVYALALAWRHFPLQSEKGRKSSPSCEGLPDGHSSYKSFSVTTPNSKCLNELHQQKQHKLGRASQRFPGMAALPADSPGELAPNEASLPGARVLREEPTLPEQNLNEIQNR